MGPVPKGMKAGVYGNDKDCGDLAGGAWVAGPKKMRRGAGTVAIRFAEEIC